MARANIRRFGWFRHAHTGWQREAGYSLLEVLEKHVEIPLPYISERIRKAPLTTLTKGAGSTGKVSDLEHGGIRTSSHAFIAILGWHLQAYLDGWAQGRLDDGGIDWGGRPSLTGSRLRRVGRDPEAVYDFERGAPYYPIAAAPGFDCIPLDTICFQAGS